LRVGVSWPHHGGGASARADGHPALQAVVAGADGLALVLEDVHLEEGVNVLILRNPKTFI
jgi:hypothetical protein